MKKLISITSTAVLLSSLVGCGSDNNDNTTPPPSTPPSSTVTTITVVDGYIKDGLLTDANGQVGTYTSNGKYTLATSPKYPLFFTGGKYLDTNRSFDINMTSQSGLIISPITTFLETNTSLQTKLAVALSLSDSMESFAVDYIDTNSTDLAKLSQVLYLILKDTNLTKEFKISMTTAPANIDSIYTLVEEDINATMGSYALNYRNFLTKIRDINSTVSIVDYETHISSEKIDLDLDFNFTPTHNGTTYGSVVSPFTGKVWLDRNLGASQVCTALADTNCYGDYYQWGRQHDGHQELNATSVVALATDLNTTGNPNIIFSINTNQDWVDVDTTDIDDNGSVRALNWSKTDGSSICPVGYRVPTQTEIELETTLASIPVIGMTSAFDNFLKLPSAGHRIPFSTQITSTAGSGWIWVVTTPDSNESNALYYGSTGNIQSYRRSTGLTVRCIKD